MRPIELTPLFASLQYLTGVGPRLILLMRKCVNLPAGISTVTGDQALAFVRFPQFPSSRTFGDAPAVSTWEYRARVPNDPALAQIVPVPPRPFPAALRDADLLPARWTLADCATLVWCVLSVVGVPLLLWRWWTRRRDSRDPRPPTLDR